MYEIAAEQECVVGMHWCGVYLMEGFGVEQDLQKSEQLLQKACKEGNG